ncbi:hypothetical protein IKE_05960 [Bacillus cereus VD196]|uniref:Uncharacterized protein n=1 Tax=Bacillus cereus VD196 TaxID=1053243 RepID=A0A9W5V5Z1_BACCE|nr:hypothetical protein IKG_05939 [Bacillus cereus VD200]EOO60513.1 hypothetical protein IKE_05960 [Bacillus cereus VD196]
MEIDSASIKARKYISNEGWKIVNIRDQISSNKKRDDGTNKLKDSLECLDQAVRRGLLRFFIQGQMKLSIKFLYAKIF